MNAITIDSIRPETNSAFRSLMAALGRKLVRALEFAGKPYTVNGAYYM
ncbi:hypothetical protein [Massilia sp.]